MSQRLQERINALSPQSRGNFVNTTTTLNSLQLQIFITPICLLMHPHRFASECSICLDRGSCLLWLFPVSVKVTFNLGTIVWCFQCVVREDDIVVSFPEFYTHPSFPSQFLRKKNFFYISIDFFMFNAYILRYCGIHHNEKF